MIDSGDFNCVRAVENKSLEEESDRLKYNELGTKVYSDAVSSGGKDTLMPLEAALGYDVSQGVFISRNYLLVEGKSDEIYRVISDLLEKSGKQGLGPWNIVSMGGIGNARSFVRFFGAIDLNLAVLVDSRNNEKQQVENLSNESAIDEDRVLTYADFTGSREADIEDMLTSNFYLELVNETYGISIERANLPKRSGIIRRLESYLEKNPIPNNVRFSHIKPAEHLRANIKSIEVPEEVLDRFQKVFDKLTKRENAAPERLPIPVVPLSKGELETKVRRTPVSSAAFVSAAPPGGNISANGSIAVTFDNAPADVTVSAGTVTVAGKSATITGPFTPGALALTITWADGTQADGHSTGYRTSLAAPSRDGDDVDPEAINSDAKIEIEFSEDVSGLPCIPKVAMMSVGLEK